MTLEKVYAIYSFLADCDEELDFKYGEPIIVLEKDEMYGDGWWKGRNIRGRVGLFPMNYTSNDNPRDPLEHKNLRNNNLSKPVSPPPFSIDETIDELQDKLQRMMLKKSSSLSTSSSYVSAPISSEKTSPTNSQLLNTFDNLKNLSFSTSSSDNNYINEDLKFKDHPSTWDVQKVCQWLDEKGYHSERKHFIENDITGDILLELNLVTLKEINISSFGKRIRLKNEIALLKNQYSTNDNVNDDQTQSKTLSGSSFGGSDINVPNHSLSNVDETFSDFSSKLHSNLQTIPPSSKDSEPSMIVKKPSRSFLKFGSFSKATNKKEKVKKFDKQEVKPKIEKIFSNKDDVRPTSEVEKRSLRFILRKNKKSILDRNSLVENQLGFFKELLVHEDIDSKNRGASYYSDPDHSSVNCIDDDILRIGVPDHQGSLMKQGDKYKTWRKRYCILKGSDLYYLQDDKTMKTKGHINLTGYRVIPDENIYQGKYGFKLVHDTERPHFFAHENLATTKAWMKAIIKSTIERNIAAPVVSSNNVSTITLSEAASRMVPSRPAPSPPLVTNNNTTNLSPRRPSTSDSEQGSEISLQHKLKVQPTRTPPSYPKPSTLKISSRPTSPVSNFNSPTKKRSDSVTNQPKFPSMSVSLLNAHRSPACHENKFSGISMGYYV
ncbi:14009_t:CDS:2 [Funneliformis caledonium]|uniref:14009_t:CDS:1 n=1 Tax=Funneliformis caledonium TaxID=1117310 RepID=A0A9N8VE63_9GLOM|nr:14009_t:CDS:2 [Funneliformis caledonium]